MNVQWMPGAVGSHPLESHCCQCFSHGFVILSRQLEKLTQPKMGTRNSDLESKGLYPRHVW